MKECLEFRSFSPGFGFWGAILTLRVSLASVLPGRGNTLLWRNLINLFLILI